MTRCVHMLLAGCSVVTFLYAPLHAQLTTSRGFLRPTSTPGSFTSHPDPIISRLCRLTAALSPLTACPGTLTEVVPPRNFLPRLDIAADLPHLRFDLALKRIENKTVSGDGIAYDQDAPNFALWTIDSAAATDEDPSPWLGGLGVPVPGPDEFDTYNSYIAIMYSGVIANGCSPATIFDVTLDSHITSFNDATLGQVHLSDAVTGNGYYVFNYTVRATDSRGTSDFIFSGDARAYCTGQSAL